MLRLLTICGNGMGTSTIIKIKLKGICNNLNLKVSLESCSAGEANAYTSNTDIIITTPQWGKMIKYPESTKLVTLINLMDDKALTEKLLEVVKEYFPNEIQG